MALADFFALVGRFLSVAFILYLCTSKLVSSDLYFYNSVNLILTFFEL